MCVGLQCSFVGLLLPVLVSVSESTEFSPVLTQLRNNGCTVEPSSEALCVDGADDAFHSKLSACFITYLNIKYRKKKYSK